MSTLNEKKRWRVPHTYVIIAGFVLLMAILTYIIPSGTYDYVYDQELNRDVVDPNSFKYVEGSPVSIMTLLTSITKGMQGCSDVIFLVFILGGAMEIVNATGALDRSVGSLVNNKIANKLFIPVLAFIFGLGGATFGMSDELVVFVPIGVALAHAMGYDALTGVATVALGAAVGFNAGILNPFSTGIAQDIAQLPLYSGVGYRIIIFVVFFIITVAFITRYAKKVKKNPELSIVHDCECELEKTDTDVTKLAKINTRDVVVLLVIFAGMAVMAYGVFAWEWYIDEISAVFIGIGIICGFISKMNASTIATKFVDGAASLTFGALVTGFAKAIVIIMQDGVIMDTVIHALSTAVTAIPSFLAVIGMYFVQIFVNFFIPSSTGQAATVMPIMVPLADVVGITRQTAVLCFQFGDGFSNSIIPTSSVLMSYLAVAKVPYERWVKFVWPIMLIWIGVGAIALIIANCIHYGPF